MNPYSDALKFLLRTLTTTGHLPATAQAQQYLDAIEAQESGAVGLADLRPPQPPAPAELKQALEAVPGLTLVPPKPDSTDAHNAAVSKTK